jgi:predicted NAD/FAD-binding protein
MRIAVIGGGIAGLGAAWALSRRHDVALFESEPRPGGHADTAEVADRGRFVPVDTGFIVYNERNYPNLVRLFGALGVATHPSDMSFAVSIGDGAYEYRARTLGLFAQPGNLARPEHVRMVREIVRFSRQAKALVGEPPGETTRHWLDRHGYSAVFRRRFLLPMIACIWSSSLDRMGSYPAATMAGFLDNHGLLDLGERPRWRTVTGGSRAYVRRIVDGLPDVRLDTPVHTLRRSADHVDVVDARGHADRFDHVVLATHADTALAIVGDDAGPEERSTLGAFPYQRNVAVLHHDPSLMPRRRRAWSSWNYLAATDAGDDRVCLTYWMNSLQGLRTDRPVLVTLNPSREPRDAVSSVVYHHPRFDGGAVDAQRRLPGLQGRRRTWFAGSYHGYGFHEDALRSGLAVAAALGSPAPWWEAEGDGIRADELVTAGR